MKKKKEVINNEKLTLLMNAEVYNNLIKEITNHDSSYPSVFLLSQDKRKIVVSALKLEIDDTGCTSMPGIKESSIHKEYLKSVKSGLFPCGLARISHRNDRCGKWTQSGSPGDAIKFIHGVMVSINPNNFIVEMYDKDSDSVIELELKLTNKLVRK